MAEPQEQLIIRGQIYYIHCQAENKGYVGQAVTHRKKGNRLIDFGYLKRFEEHKKAALAKGKSYKSAVHHAILEHGPSQFTVILLEECNLSDIDARERHWIDERNTLYPNGYNVLYGAPYDFNSESRAKMSKTLQEYFKNQHVKEQYSKAHQNHFHPVDPDDVKSIRLNPINQNGTPTIVYMYITKKDETVHRRRYGGKHEDFVSAMDRAKRDAESLCPTNTSIVASRIDTELQKIDPDNVLKCELKLHKMGNHRLVSVYTTTFETTSAKDRIRHVFGGKTITLNDAFDQAYSFATRLTTNIDIQESLIATLPNCSGNP